MVDEVCLTEKRVLINIKHKVFGNDEDSVIKHWTCSDPFDTKELKTQKIAQLNATAKKGWTHYFCALKNNNSASSKSFFTTYELLETLRIRMKLYFWDMDS